MGDNSKIDWTDATWNPIVGCSRVSAGCDHCYAIRDANRMAGNPNPKLSDTYTGLTTTKPSVGLDWTGVVRCLPERLEIPLRWKRPRRIFVNSQSDLFHPSVPDEFIRDVFAVMGGCPQHTFQILTKRPDRMQRYLSGPPVFAPGPWPLPNVWLGASVEDQQAADARIQWLVKTPAALRFLSCEPLLSPVNVDLSGIGWVIVGGESGPGARPMHPHWPWSLRAQCLTAGVPFFFKQWGEWGPEGGVAGQMPGQRPMAWLGPGGGVVRWGKHLSGRELDGRTWDEFPAVPV